MTNLTIFNFENTPVQTIVENNEIFFRAAQLAELLKYSNPHKAIKDHVDPDDLTKREIVNSVNKRAQVLFVNESGMYSLILSSKLESAKRVKRWVTAEVLPQIRKTGKYQVQKQLALPETTTDDRKGLRDAITTLVNKKGLIYSEVYSLVHQQFNVSHIDELTKIQISQAVQYIHFLTLNLDTLFQKGEEINISAYIFDAIMKHAKLAQKLAEKVINYQEKQFALLGIEDHFRHNELTASANSLLGEFKYFLREGETLLAKHSENPQLTQQVKLSKLDF